MNLDTQSNNSEIFRHILPEIKAEPIRKELLSTLETEHPTAFKIWKESVRKRAVNLDFRLDEQSFMAEIDKGELTLGLAPFTPSLEYLRFNSDLLDAKDIKNERQMRLLHEIGHPWIRDLLTNPDYQYRENLRQIYQVMKSRRMARPNSGMTAHASLRMYAKLGPATQAEEELVEMSAMWMWDPNYLKEYFASLSSQEKSSYWQTIGVNPLPPEAAKGYFSLLDTFMSESVHLIK